MTAAEVTVGQDEAFGALLENVVEGFLDAEGIREAYREIYPERDFDDPDICGVNVSLQTLVEANIEGFAELVLERPDSRHYLLKCSGAKVAAYLKEFDVFPHGPDLLKYIAAFGWSLEGYSVTAGERPIVAAIVRMQTLRLLRNAAGMFRDDESLPPQAMVRKVAKIWKNRQETKLLGGYGTYMMFKTWSLG